MCPAVSKAQKNFFSLVHAIQKGDVKPSDVGKNIKDTAKNMTQKDVKDFAFTSTKDLPKKVKKEELEKIIENKIRKILKEDWYLTNANKYHLLSHTPEEGEMVTNEIDKLIDNFGNGYKKIYDKFPTSALGDTAVADAVHDKVFNKIHIDALIESIIKRVLNESRSKDIEYLVKEAKDGGGKVIAELHKQKAGYVNKIVGQYEEIVQELNKLKILKEAIDPQIKEYIASIFNKEDEIYTRVIETNRMMITLSKASERNDFKMKDFIEQLDKSGLANDIIESIKKMIEASYKVAKVAPSLKGELKKQNEANIISKLIDWVKGFFHKINDYVGHKTNEMEKKIKMLQRIAAQMEQAQKLQRIN